MEGMDGPDLFDGMYADDTGGKKLKEMPGVDDLMITYPLHIHTYFFSCLIHNFESMHCFTHAMIYGKQ